MLYAIHADSVALDEPADPQSDLRATLTAHKSNNQHMSYYPALWTEKNLDQHCQVGHAVTWSTPSKHRGTNWRQTIRKTRAHPV